MLTSDTNTVPINLGAEIYLNIQINFHIKVKGSIIESTCIIHVLDVVKAYNRKQFNTTDNFNDKQHQFKLKQKNDAL